MSDISVTGAAFAGLRAIQRKPATAVVWAIVGIVIAFVGTAAVAATVGPAMAEMQAIRAAGPQVDPQAALGATGRMMGGFLLLVPLYLVLAAITTAAGNRAILQPEDTAPGYLRLGGDEFRIGVVLLVIGLIVFVMYFVAAIVAGLVVALTGGAMGGVAPDPAKVARGFLIGLT
ncbi:MAG: hypothetical protein JWO33_272, partial [Caulobacteraceae bacterium]|nr:hypothetical protein [Caulobacteraceae bacterium]